MRKSAILPQILVVTLLGLMSTQALAQTYKYRLYNKGVSSGAGGTPATGGTTVPPGGTTTPPPTGTETGGTGETGGTTTPPPSPTYATSGVRWSVNGTQTFQTYLGPGEVQTVTLHNTSSNTLQGFLGTSQGGYGATDLSGSTCSQNAAGTVPTTLAPGASCTFKLVGTASQYARPADYFWFKAANGQVIPDSLYLPEIEYVTEPTGPDEF